MPCDKTALFDFLSVLDEDLTKKITLVVAGGTAMTLLDLKPSTIDIGLHNSRLRQIRI